MIHCRNCGGLSADGAKFCSFCGSPLAIAPSVTPPQNQGVAKPSKPVTSNNKGPAIPAGNRYAGHEKLISKIAHEIVAYCTEVTSPTKWYQGERPIRITHGYQMVVHPGSIMIHSLGPDPRGYTEISLCRDNMRPIPDTKAFVDAIFPFVDAYFSDRIRTQFATASIHVRPTIHNRKDSDHSVFYLEVQEHHAADQSLKSW